MQTIGQMTDKQIADMVKSLVFETTLGKRNGTPTTLQMNVAELPANAFTAIAAYGGQRYVNDRVGGSDTTHEQKVEEAKALIARLKAGDVGRAERKSVDPIMHEATLAFKAWLRAKKPDLYKQRKDDDEWIAAAIAKNPQFVEAGKREYERKLAAKRAVDKIDAEVTL